MTVPTVAVTPVAPPGPENETARPVWKADPDRVTAIPEPPTGTSAGVSETGCTVHLASVEVDAGPILAQEVVPVLPGDTEETLHERIKVAERSLYPATVAWALGELAAGREIERRGTVPVRR